MGMTNVLPLDHQYTESAALQKRQPLASVNASSELACRGISVASQVFPQRWGLCSPTVPVLQYVSQLRQVVLFVRSAINPERRKGRGNIRLPARWPCHDRGIAHWYHRFPTRAPA